MLIAKTNSQFEGPGSALLPFQIVAQPRILVVEDDDTIRRMNGEVLSRAGYHVDAAADGAAAWETLQKGAYDLLVTDNDMPKVTGVELLEKMHSAKMGLPVIMAVGKLPEAEFIRAPWLTPAAVLLKPYTFEALLGTVKTLLLATAPMIAMFWFLTGTSQGQEVKPAAPPANQTTDYDAQPSAMTISVRGTCEYSEDGVKFAQLKKGRILEQGAIIRTGEDSRTDLFFRRTGTVVRLQAGTELRIEKMTLTVKDGLPLVQTLLDLRAGRIFTVVRRKVAGSTLEIRNAAGRAVVEGSGVGRYIITADGTHVAAEGSAIPLKVVRENGITIVAAGQQFNKKEGKAFAVSSGDWVSEMMELDELEAATEESVAHEAPAKP